MGACSKNIATKEVWPENTTSFVFQPQKIADPWIAELISIMAELDIARRRSVVCRARDEKCVQDTMETVRKATEEMNELEARRAALKTRE